MREKHRLVASHVLPDQDQTHNPGMCPDWELNLQHFVLPDGKCSTKLSHTRQGTNLVLENQVYRAGNRMETSLGVGWGQEA